MVKFISVSEDYYVAIDKIICLHKQPKMIVIDTVNIGETILKSCIQNYISLEDTYDLNTIRQHVVETQFSKTQQEDYTFVVTSLTLIS